MSRDPDPPTSESRPDAGREERPPEERLDALRREARRTGGVRGRGVEVEGGPIPGRPAAGAGGSDGTRGPAAEGDAPPRDDDSSPGYYGLPVVKPPVWTWEVPLYFFVGGLAGMSAVLALGGLVAGQSILLVRAALWIAAIGAFLSAGLLIADLGRPARFLNMLRVFKWRSPMSVGAWLLSVFGGLALFGALVVELVPTLGIADAPTGWAGTLLALLVTLAGVAGAALATYTGVLIGATTIPAWFSHRALLPVHFGVAGLGSAAALLELLGFRIPALWTIGLLAAAAECGVGLATELDRHGAADRALREGRAGWQLRAAALLAGPVSLALRLLGWVPGAGAAFLLGSLLSRYGWLEAGRASGRDPEATFAAQRSREA